MKIKYFYPIGLIFFGVMIMFTPICGNAAKLSKEDLAEIQKIKEHNARQKKNHVSIEEYHKKNSQLKTIKSEDYWDLAWHARLADYGDEESQYVIARAYDEGKEVAPNPKKAVAFYEKSCDQGHVDACMRLGEVYRENKWLQRDDEKSLYWYTKAAETDYVQAQLKVSELYKEQGDYISAVKWLETGLKQLFPNVTNLAETSPELIALRELADLQKKMNERGVHKNVLHESCLTSFDSRQFKVVTPATSDNNMEQPPKIGLQPFKTPAVSSKGVQ